MIEDRDIIRLKEVFATKEEFGELKHDIIWLKNDVTGLKSDVAGLKHDVIGLKEEMVEVKFELAEVKNRMDHLETTLTYKIEAQGDRLAGLITDFMTESKIASA